MANEPLLLLFPSPFHASEQPAVKEQTWQLEQAGAEPYRLWVVTFALFLQPTKVLGIYTFTKRVALEEFENKPRKQQGYSTVSHFNIVHYDCHLAAVR